MLDAEVTFQDVLRGPEKEWRQRVLSPAALETLRNLPKKKVAGELASRLGLSVPATLFGPATLDEILRAVERLPDRLVVKPARGSGSVGVVLLNRRNGRYFDILGARETSLDEVEALLRGVIARKQLNDEWIAEELVVSQGDPDKPVHDLKLYSFYGEIALILQRKSSRIGGKWWKSTYQWYDDNWKPVDVGKYVDQIDTQIDVPEGAAAVLDVARHTSLRLPVPFMRIDLYDSPLGVRFGEFTATPGGAADFNEEWRSKLVSAWYRSADRLTGDLSAPLVRSGIEALEATAQSLGLYPRPPQP